MNGKAPEKSHREGTGLVELAKMFPDDEVAQCWFEKRMWPNGPRCPHCGTTNVQNSIRHKTMTHRCRECEGKPRFSLKTGNVMEGSKLGYRTWAIAVHLLATDHKGVSSMKLHRGLDITQKSAWHLAHRLRTTFENGDPLFAGLAQADETYWNGKRKNTPKSKPGQEAFPVSRLPVVNVATVPQRSPLRYPGGKTWLIPHIRQWLRETTPEVLIEPFAGGAIVSLTAVMEDLAPSAVMIEIDRDVAAFWRSALESGATLGEWVKRFDPTRENLEKLTGEAPRTVEEHGFRTLVLNRTRRGGILAPGASFTRNGENGKGLRSRWYPETLASRLAAIDRHADRLAFVEGDGMKLLPVLLHGWGRRAAVFLDPPYTAQGGKRAGSRLYSHWAVDHAELFQVVADHDCNFLITYDAAPEIAELVRQHNFNAVRLSMKNSHHNRVRELVITAEPLFT